MEMNNHSFSFLDIYFMEEYTDYKWFTRRMAFDLGRNESSTRFVSISYLIELFLNRITTNECAMRKRRK